MNFIIIGGLILLAFVIIQSLWYAKRYSELKEKIRILENDNVEITKRLNAEVAKRIANGKDISFKCNICKNKEGRNEIDLLTKY